MWRYGGRTVARRSGFSCGRPVEPRPGCPCPTELNARDNGGVPAASAVVHLVKDAVDAIADAQLALNGST